jgi:hypothetical protein
VSKSEQTKCLQCQYDCGQHSRLEAERRLCVFWGHTVYTTSFGSAPRLFFKCKFHWPRSPPGNAAKPGPRVRSGPSRRKESQAGYFLSICYHFPICHSGRDRGAGRLAADSVL